MERIYFWRIVQGETERLAQAGADDVAVGDDEDFFTFVFLQDLPEEFDAAAGLEPLPVRRDFLLVRIAVNDLVVLGQLAAKDHFFRLDLFLPAADRLGGFGGAIHVGRQNQVKSEMLQIFAGLLGLLPAFRIQARSGVPGRGIQAEMIFSMADESDQRVVHTMIND
jgi:hypothetical protein